MAFCVVRFVDASGKVIVVLSGGLGCVVVVVVLVCVFEDVSLVEFMYVVFIACQVELS